MDKESRYAAKQLGAQSSLQGQPTSGSEDRGRQGPGSAAIKRQVQVDKPLVSPPVLIVAKGGYARGQQVTCAPDCTDSQV